jgi:O-antigen chain-terminating methyltransferase
MVVRNLERQEVLMFRREQDVRQAINVLAQSTEVLAKALSSKVERTGMVLSSQVALLRADISAVSEDVETRAPLKDALGLAEAAARDVGNVIEQLQALDERKADNDEVSRLSNEGAERIATVASSLAAVEVLKADANEVRARFEAAEGQLQAKADALEVARRFEAAEGQLQAKADALEVARRFEAAEGQLQAKADASGLVDQFSSMLTRERLETALASGEEDLEEFYLAFENRFRGTREDIKGRVSVYLPIVRDAGAGTAESPILDIGCGRGEWLELLRDSGLMAHGLDINSKMAGFCRQAGLDVREGDAIEYLRGQRADSLGAVTGIHVIEHLPFRRFVALFDEVLRVLRPGGLVIFETPNPENVIVGSCNFWYDPTHHHPLPPEGTRFIAESRGFAKVDILRLHPYPPDQQLQDGTRKMRERLNQVLFGSQDYSVVAYKGR